MSNLMSEKNILLSNATAANNINNCIIIEQSGALNGQIELSGAKNAVLVIMASLILTTGKSVLHNVPDSADVHQMILLLQDLGVQVVFNKNNQELIVDTTGLDKYTISPQSMKKMRASILVMGPLLARFGRADVALPGGCVIGARPIDFHLKAFAQMGVNIDFTNEFIKSSVNRLQGSRIVLEYPSVGATENIIMAAALTQGITSIINASLEPEVLDLINILTAMGARINIAPPSTIIIEGVDNLRPVKHSIIPDRLEAGSLLIAAAITGGHIAIPNAQAYALDVFLDKLSEMGHEIKIGHDGNGIQLKATTRPKAVSFKTMPYPGFPTDLQAPMMAAQCLADGVSVIHETVYENRLVHVRELQKMGAHITVEGHVACIKGTDTLYGAQVIATDIRASAALVVAGLAAQGQTVMTGVHHLVRGYQDFDQKLIRLGANIRFNPNVQVNL